MEERIEAILILILLLLLVFFVYKFILSISKIQRIRDIEELSKNTSSKLLIKKGIVFDKINNTIIPDQDIIV